MMDIVIIGTGGFGREVLELIHSINAASRSKYEYYNILGFLDSNKDLWGTKVNGFEVLGDESYLDNITTPICVAIGIGSPGLKRKIVENLEGHPSVEFPNLIHPNVILGQSGVTFGVGNIITAGNILTCNITIKNHVMINLAGTVGHDVTIEDFVVVSPGVNISGNVILGEGSYVGTGATILEKKNIGRWSIVGGGALVNSDIPENTTAVGTPAKVIKTRDEGWHL